MYNYTLTLILIFSLTAAEDLLSQSHAVIHDTIEGAPIKVVTPEGWSGGNVFFHIHGWRPDDAPHEADLDLENPFYQTLLEENWAIGRTAFKKNGVDHDAHIKALYSLKNWFIENLGPVERLIMEGESTAGTLMLRIAEQNPDLADGVIAMGAFVNFEDENDDSYLEATPKIPAILMSNLTELEGPIAYAAKAEDAEIIPALRPLLRVGHVNVNWTERRDAFYDLKRWLDGDEIAKVSEGTRNVPERKRTSEIIEKEHSLKNNVYSVDKYFGNMILDVHPGELASIGIEQGNTFLLNIHNRMRLVYYGESYGDVPQGEWVAFNTADDRILVARNHESASQTADSDTGDSITIYKLH